MAQWFLTDYSSPIFWACLAIVWVLFVFHEYLGWREYQVKKRNTVLPDQIKSIYTQEEFDKSRTYAIDKAQFGFLQSAISIVESSALLIIGALPFAWQLSGQISKSVFGSYHSEIMQSLVFIMITTLYQTVTTTPFSYYDTFVIEARHGMNKQTLGFWIMDKLKGFALGLVIGLPITAALIKIIQIGGNYVFLYAWLLVVGLSIFMITIYQDYIAPIFDKFMNLPEGSLRDSIQKMADELGFPLHRLYIVEGSKRSLHSNAYFSGLFWRKSIVLYDTLLEHSPFAKKPDADSTLSSKKATGNADEPSADALLLDKKKEEAGDVRKQGSLDDEDYEVVNGDAATTTSASSSPGRMQTRSMTTNVKEGSDVLEKIAADESEADRLHKTENDRKLTNASKCTEQEVMAILCHEFGHWMYGHVYKSMAISWVTTLIDLYVFGLLYQRSDIYRAFGFNNDKPIIMGLIIIFTFIFSPVHELLGIAMTYLSRRNEFQADSFAKARNYAEYLKSSLKKLSVGNLSFPLHDKLYSAVNHSHPTLLERLDFLDKTD